MTIQYLPKFQKQYKKLPPNLQLQFDDRLRLLLADPSAPQLRLHPLKGSFAGYWSININGDIRVLYLKRGDEILIFALIGTHSELYG
ncbi:type II toxin-antitoxin system mRNA interferase toxin, RelE/StbE family [Candidatus Saccharibacteria bacterium]|nr:type II toxin-antitoxin system mRNA interferase toxin, RelE/StbE family [Candidatus Saccharibacteria bacterium]